ncbi:MAG TPA: NAD-dependent epimerase/dehydratase family protein [Rhodopila sp.]|nr:NAD-dependent epimerase/dehydratase family protein [Rhodopila sp.]
MNAPRVLLTGASGFVGRQVIGPLLERAYEVHAVGNTVTDPRARWYRADLLDQGARRQLVAAVRPDAVLHCAWVTRPGVYWTSPLNLDWVAASLDLARLAADQGARRMLMVGSCAEYDWRSLPARPWREDDLCRPGSLYGTAKDSLHRLMAAFAVQAEIGLVWARLFHLYGPYEAPSRLVPSLLGALREARRPEIGPGEAVRDFMHVADAGRALAHLLMSATSGAVNVASGQPIAVGALAGLAARSAGRPDLLAVSVRATAEPLAMLASTTKLRATGYMPSIALEDGLAALWSEKKGQGSALDPQKGDAPLNPFIEGVGGEGATARVATTASPPPPSLAVPRAMALGGVEGRSPRLLSPDYEAAARLFRADRRDEARAAAEAVLVRQPDHAPALNLLGVLHRQRGDFLRARGFLERAAALDPDSETAWINLGNVHLDMEATDAAADAYARGLAVAPERIDTLRLLGNALSRAGRDAEAMMRLDEAVAAGVPGAVRDRARAHYTAGRVDAALADLERLDDVEARLIKAQMLRLSGHAGPAAALLRELLAQAPENADVHLSLADALLAEEHREAANEHYARAVALRPDDTNAEGKLCWSLLNSRYGSEADHIAEAAAIARRIVARGVPHPSSAHAVQSALLRVADLETLAAFDALFPDRRVLLDYWVRRNVVGALHAQLGRVQTMQDRLTLIDCHREWGDRYEAKPVPLRTVRPPPGPRIRVGFVSSDLRHHPVSYFALPIFDHYDRDRFEVFAYSFNPGAPDAVQRRIAGKIAEFRRMPNLPEQDIARRIADDRLDILFELGGSTHLNRLEVMAHQPAPVQVSWLGYPHSSGLSRIGYILVDPYLKPPDPRLLLERPFEMPASWVSLGPLGFTDHPILPGLPEERAGRLTFGTMNNPYKYAPDSIALWARVLHRVPGSRFLMVRPEAGVALFRDNMARAFARHGIASDRLAYAAVRGQHMAHYNDIDIALDTLPQTGGTTTCECLWMGVPTVSLVGPAFFERLSFSNLANAGLRDLAVDTPDAYVDTAVALAADVERRRALRAGLRATIRQSPLGDARQWVRDFEALTLRTLDAGSTVEALSA